MSLDSTSPTLTPANNMTVNVTPDSNASGVMAGPSSSLDGTTATAPTTGNAYEKQVTPLLREISRKKAVLELKRLDVELAKLDAEQAKSEQEKNQPAPAAAPATQNVGGLQLFNPNPTSTPNGLPGSGANALSSLIATGDKASDLRVLMTYGFDDNLYAKISSGTQGGYVVKKGDVLPDGRIVTDITANYIEVKKGAKSKKGSDKIFVTGPAPVGPNGAPIVSGSAGAASSASIAPTIGGVPTVGTVSTPGLVGTLMGNIPAPKK